MYATVEHTAALVVAYIFGVIVVGNLAVALVNVTRYHVRYLRHRHKRGHKVQVFTVYPRVRRHADRGSFEPRK